VIWTSGQYAPSCGKFVWCPEKEVISKDAMWKKGFPKSGEGDCIALQVGSENPDDNGQQKYLKGTMFLQSYFDIYHILGRYRPC